MKDFLKSLTGGKVSRSNVIPGVVQPDEGPVPDIEKNQELIKQKEVLTEEQKKSIFEEDSVLHDLKLFRNFLLKKMGLMSSKATEKVGKVKSSNKAMKTLRMIMVFVILIILCIVGLSVFNKVKKDIADKEDEFVAENKPSPTPIDFRPNTPSKYADDEEVLVLEEQIEALEKEIGRTSLRDSSIYPPNVDYNVDFKK